jgi:hypothetical protein
VRVGILIDVVTVMRRNATRRQPMRLLRWIFLRGNETLTCQVDQRPGDATFTLSLIPQSDIAAGIAETFSSACSAFRRHAMIASELRRSGWTLAAYTAD